VTQDRKYERLGPYVAVRVSGVGGMGRVQLAVRADSPAGEVCVIKRMAAVADVPDQVARFRREAQIAARLAHPNIARTLRVEEIGGELCIAQEYIQGMDLGRLMRQLLSKPVPVPVAVFVAREVAAGLAYAHSFGGNEIVHRDVSPENVMISFDGDVKLIDFGIARSAVDGTLTSVGAVVGRREYIAPESWEGAKPDRRADVYALGVVLWEALTGRRVEEMRDGGPVKALGSPRELNDSIPEPLAAVVLRALAGSPVERYQSCDELSAALEPFAAGATAKQELAELVAFNFNVSMYRDVIADDIRSARSFLESQRSSPQTPRRRWWLWGAAGAVVAATVAVIFVPRHSPTPPAVAAPAARATEPSPAPAAEVPFSPAVPTNVAVAASGEIPAHRALVKAAASRRPAASDVPSSAAPARKAAADLLAEAQDTWDRGNTTRAIALAKSAIASGAGAPGHVLLGAILLNSNKHEAERELAEAVRLDPQNRQAKNLLALAQQKIAEGE
jgi:serine/threonine protein kinase